MKMKSVLAKISKELLLEKLESDLQTQQRKYNYHKKIAENYQELTKQTQQKMSEVDSNVL